MIHAHTDLRWTQHHVKAVRARGERWIVWALWPLIIHHQHRHPKRDNPSSHLSWSKGTDGRTCSSGCLIDWNRIGRNKQVVKTYLVFGLVWQVTRTRSSITAQWPKKADLVNGDDAALRCRKQENWWAKKFAGNFRHYITMWWFTITSLSKCVLRRKARIKERWVCCSLTPCGADNGNISREKLMEKDKAVAFELPSLEFSGILRNISRKSDSWDKQT